MLGIIIPTRNAADHLPDLLATLGNAPVRIVVSDGGSTDKTLNIALPADAVLAVGNMSRGGQLARGADLCGADGRISHYLFLHADCLLPKDWADAVQIAMGHEKTAWYFRFDPAGVRGVKRAWLCFIVGLRCWAWKLPYGDQGLLMSRSLYEAMGGYRTDYPLFEDVDMAERIVKSHGRGGLKPLPLAMKTDVSAHIQDGIWRRGWRNYKLLRAYKSGVSVTDLLRRYK